MKTTATILCATALLGSLHAKESVTPSPSNDVQGIAKDLSIKDIYKSVVRIEVASLNPNYATPWNSGNFSGGTGTGFLIGKNQFLTNAHVVSNARRVLVTLHGSPRQHSARVVHIAHDCDLALLEVDDFTPFEGLPYLPIGNVPALESEVRVIGYPVGGERISITRGVVSRIDFRQYAHSRADSHLIVQIDAAINPGNSGGPVIQDGKVAGVAFQGLSAADNTGYMIPTPVVKRFLKDIADGHYDQYVDIGAINFPLFNPAMRKVFGLKQDDPGVLISKVAKESSTDGILEKGDILIAVDGKPVDASGSVQFSGERVNMNEIVERKFSGDKVHVTFLRKGEKKEADITLKSFPPSRKYAIQYGVEPLFTLQGGLLLQPLDLNLYSAHQLNNPRVRRLFANYLKEEIYIDRPDLVILTRVLDDPINSEMADYSGNAVSSINGVKVRDIRHAHELLHPEKMPEFFVITLDGIDRPLILPSQSLAEANARIMQNYSISISHRLDQQ